MTDFAGWRSAGIEFWDWTSGCLYRTVKSLYRSEWIKRKENSENSFDASVQRENNFERIGIDVAGPFPGTEIGNKCFLVVYYFSKWVEMYPISNQEAASILTFLVRDLFYVSVLFGTKLRPPQKLSVQYFSKFAYWDKKNKNYPNKWTRQSTNTFPKWFQRNAATGANICQCFF